MEEIIIKWDKEKNMVNFEATKGLSMKKVVVLLSEMLFNIVNSDNVKIEYAKQLKRPQ